MVSADGLTGIPFFIVKFFQIVYYIIIGFIYKLFIQPVGIFLWDKTYTDAAGRQYNMFKMFVLFSLLVTFALSALLYGGAFFMIGTIIYGWVVLFKKLKQFREKNK